MSVVGLCEGVGVARERVRVVVRVGVEMVVEGDGEK